MQAENAQEHDVQQGTREMCNHQDANDQDNLRPEKE
jgi:hypothetical protein